MRGITTEQTEVWLCATIDLRLAQGQRPQCSIEVHQRFCGHVSAAGMAIDLRPETTSETKCRS